MSTLTDEELFQEVRPLNKKFKISKIEDLDFIMGVGRSIEQLVLAKASERIADLELRLANAREELRTKLYFQQAAPVSQPTLAAPQVTSGHQCNYPLCQSEAEQKRIADEVHRQLYTGDPQETHSALVRDFSDDQLRDMYRTAAKKSTAAWLADRSGRNQHLWRLHSFACEVLQSQPKHTEGRDKS